MRREAVRAAAGRPQELSQQAVTRDSAGAGAPAAQGADPIAGDPTTATNRSGANPRAPARGPGAFLQGRPPSPEPIPGHSTPRPPRTDAPHYCHRPPRPKGSAVSGVTSPRAARLCRQPRTAVAQCRKSGCLDGRPERRVSVPLCGGDASETPERDGRLPLRICERFKIQLCESRCRAVPQFCEFNRKTTTETFLKLWSNNVGSKEKKWQQ